MPYGLRRPFVEALLKAETPALDSEPRGNLGAPLFVKGNDNVTENEALLFYDDLTLPIGRVPWLIGVLTNLEEHARAVCKLEVSRGGLTQNGTGFRVGPELVLTNWHVVHVLGEQATKIVAEFGFDDDGKGDTTASKAFAGVVIQCDKGDDWAIVKNRRAARHDSDDELSNAAEPVAAGSGRQNPAGKERRHSHSGDSPRTGECGRAGSVKPVFSVIMQ